MTQFRFVADRYIREGAVQAMLCAHGGEHFRVIDREAVLNFSNTTARQEAYRVLQGPLVDALREVPVGADSWWKPPLGGGNSTSWHSMSMVGSG